MRKKRSATHVGGAPLKKKASNFLYDFIRGNSMTTGEKIKKIRIFRGMTQKELGVALGFPEKGADNRIAQYETNYRVPKNELLDKIAQVLDVAPAALSVPDIDSPVELMHTLFSLEDRYGLEIYEHNGAAYLQINPLKNREAKQLNEILLAWKQVSDQLRSGEITRAEYDRWRYHYAR